LFQAAEQGSPEALLRLAALAAAGRDPAKTLPQALQFLQAAAARGSAFADAQWRLLGGEEADIAPWLTVPHPKPLHDDPQVFSIAGFLPPGVCDWLIGRAAPDLQPATMMVGYGDVPQINSARTNSAFQFDILNADVVVGLVRARIALALRVPLLNLEPPQVLHYAQGQEFLPHYDALQTKPPGERLGEQGGDRALTLLVYLNAGYEGGATTFPRLGLRFKGAKGDALWFANLNQEGGVHRLSLHAGEAPTRGEKWLLSQWVHDRPFAERVSQNR
jgi:predicted 2-oxoglutarate/Fe(II)-dependent dioxygenase YbiX